MTWARIRRSIAPAGALLLLAACANGPSPSHVAPGYRGKLPDDTMVEASTTELVTTAPVVIALDCRPLSGPGGGLDPAAVDRAVAAGAAARLPEGVTLYTPPYSAANSRAQPFVVTDDKYAGRLCTGGSVKVLHT
ncbi:MAG TPA: hypothetical protein VMF61_13745 [Candidatus Acidoferrales bacterium]|nr:hypothetical protein [Candidatus Acidoferrales bacterium]